MLQPFQHFREQYLDRLIILKKYYVISQTYRRGENRLAGSSKIDILLTDYEDKGFAEMHFNSVKEDPNGMILNLSKSEDKGKLLGMLHDEKFVLYWSVVASYNDLLKRVQIAYKDKMRKYINYKTDWRIGGDEHITPGIKVKYGEVFLSLRWKDRDLVIKFEDIEQL